MNAGETAPAATPGVAPATPADALAQLPALLAQAGRVLTQLEAWLPPAPPPVDWSASAYRWRRRGQHGWLESVPVVGRIQLDDLQHVARQKEIVERNTRQFLAGRPANNVLMTGARGTGKSSLVKAMLTTYAEQGLRLIEVDKSDLVDLPDIVEQVAGRNERYLVFCDDLSFEAGDPAYKALKSVLDGTVAGGGSNVLIYATSNRRHLMPETMRDNLATQHQADGEIHPGEAVEEKISLSERFGLWLSFHPFRQDDYLDIVAHWLVDLGWDASRVDEARTEALQWALGRGSRSGRVAWQFAKDWVARHG